MTEGVFEPDIGLFRNLLTQVEGLGRLIEDLRVVGLAESGHLELRWTQTRLSDEVMAVVSAFEPTLQHDGFTLALALGIRWCSATRCGFVRRCWRCWRMRRNTPTPAGYVSGRAWMAGGRS